MIKKKINLQMCHMACVVGEKKVRTMLIFAISITAQKTFIGFFWFFYSVELNSILTGGASLAQKRASLYNEIRKGLVSS